MNNIVDTKIPESKLLSSPNISMTKSKDESLKQDMIKKLSLKEKWLNDNPDSFNVVVNKIQDDCKKKDEKKSFFNGIFSSVKQFIKPEKKSTSSSNEGTDEKSENNKSSLLTPKKLTLLSETNETENKKKAKDKKMLKKQKSEEIREEADGILNDIKDENDRLSKQIRDMEIKRFSDNMQAIKSSVVDSKVASIKEVNLSKYFPTVQEKKPKAFVKNQDTKALKDVNLNKYFPTQSVSKSNDSNSSSANQSPLTPKKNIDEIDLTNYFPNTPVISRRSSFAGPDENNDDAKSSTLARKDSITRVTNVNSIPANPPPPKPKNNILSLQNVKRKNNKSAKETNVQHENIKSVGNQKIKASKSNDFNMFDQLLDGAIDISQTTDFETIIEEVKLERSPSKEYDVIFNEKSRSSSKEGSDLKSKILLKEVDSMRKNEKQTKNIMSLKVVKFESHNVNGELLMDKSENSKQSENNKNNNGKKNDLPSLPKDILNIEIGASLSKIDLNIEKNIPISNKVNIPEPIIDDTTEEQINEIIEESVASRLLRKYKKIPTESSMVCLHESVSPKVEDVNEEDKVSFIEKLEQKIKERRKSLFQQSEIDEDQNHFEPLDLKHDLVTKSKEIFTTLKGIVPEIHKIIHEVDLNEADKEKNLNEANHETPNFKTKKDKSSKTQFEKYPEQELKPKNLTGDRKGKKKNSIKPLTENLNDILIDFQVTELETEKALKQFHQNLELISNKTNDDERNKNGTIIFSNESLQSNLQDIDASISEHPLNFEELFGQISISQLQPDKNEENLPIEIKKNEIEIETKNNDTRNHHSLNGANKEINLQSSSNYFNILKEISDELVCFNDKTIILSKTDLGYTFKKDSSMEPKSPTKNYSNTLQDISYEPENSNLCDKNISSKKYSQTLPYENIRFISPEQTYDSVSGISSTDTFDHYYSVVHNNLTGKFSPPRSKMAEKPKKEISPSKKNYSKNIQLRNIKDFSPKRDSLECYNQRADSCVLLQRGELLHKRKEEFLKGQSSDSTNPYIREMLRQDIDNPIDIKDIQFIRKHPSAQLPSAVYSASPYKFRTKETSTLLRPSPQRSTIYSQAPPRSYNASKSTHDSYNSSKSLKYDILTKSHTVSPHAVSLHRPSYVKNREFSFSDPLPSVRSRMPSRNSASHSSRKSSSTRENYYIF